MTMHDRRLKGGVGSRGQRSAGKVMLEGAATINIWNSLGRSPRKRQLGSVADDWRQVGSDIRRAMDSVID